MSKSAESQRTVIYSRITNRIIVDLFSALIKSDQTLVRKQRRVH